MAKHTYMRDPMPKGMRATCPLCVRGIEVKGSGLMVRHGWKETGRQVGQYGLGRQFGECPGTDDRPLEQTDEDALKHLAGLEKSRKAWLATAEEHVAGKPSYSYSIELSAKGWEEADAGTLRANAKARAALGAGLKAPKVRKYQKRVGAYQRLTDMEKRTYTIPRGFEGYKGGYGEGEVKPYENFRFAVERDARMQADALGEAIMYLRAAIKQHAAAEPVRKVERKHTLMHSGHEGRRGRMITLCGADGRCATDPGGVTCKRCLKAMAKRDEELAEIEAEKALGGRIIEHLEAGGPATVTEIMKQFGVKKRRTANRALERLDRDRRAHSTWDTPSKWKAGPRVPVGGGLIK